jgi:N-acetylglutamate synthase-like GNAT family acetyltransferase
VSARRGQNRKREIFVKRRRQRRHRSLKELTLVEKHHITVSCKAVRGGKDKAGAKR